MTYRVGDLLFALEISDRQLSEKELAPYAPFRAVRSEGEELLFTLTIVGSTDYLPSAGTMMACLEDDNGRMALYSMPDGGMQVHLTAPSGMECCRISMEHGFRRAKVVTGGTTAERRYGLDTALMLLYAFASADHNTLLIHASAVEYDGKAYLFLGKSGTGKSTHTRLWTENISGAALLNDDNPVIRIKDDGIYVYGSPWSGKTPCYLSRKVVAGAFVRLHQAPRNDIRSLHGIKAYAAVLPACSCMKWDTEMSAAVHRTVSRVIESVAVYDMECLPDREAAVMACETIRVKSRLSHD